MLIISCFDFGFKQLVVIEVCWCLLDQKGDLKDSWVFYEEEQYQGSIGDQICVQSDLFKCLVVQLVKDVKLIVVVVEVLLLVIVCKLVVKLKVKEEEGLKMLLVVLICIDVEVYWF